MVPQFEFTRSVGEHVSTITHVWVEVYGGYIELDIGIMFTNELTSLIGGAPPCVNHGNQKKKPPAITWPAGKSRKQIE